jgi:hypothetical protein
VLAAHAVFRVLHHRRTVGVRTERFKQTIVVAKTAFYTFCGIYVKKPLISTLRSI